MSSSEERTEEVRGAFDKEKKTKNTFYPTHTRLAQTVPLPLHTSENRDRQHKHIKKEKHMLTQITLHQAHAHTSPHSF